MAKSLRRASLVLFPALLAALLALSPLPVSAAEDSEKSTQSTPVSPRAKNGWAYDMVRADEAHAMGYRGQGVRVAILDNGIDPRATGITGKVVASFDAVHGVNGQQEHGTATAGDLAAGRLVKPFELSLRSPAQFAYHLITRRDTADRPMTKAFRNWILAEAAASQG